LAVLGTFVAAIVFFGSERLMRDELPRPFTLEGVPLAKNVAVLEAGVDMQLRPNLTLGASYSGQFGDGLEDHGFKASLNWTF
jgi:uncharacterized protein with beta-barrel porin domain